MQIIIFPIFLYSEYKQFNVDRFLKNWYIVNTIGSIDDLIEENSFKIKLLQELGFNYFLDKIRKDYELINISDLHIKYGMSLVKNIRIKGEIPLLASNGVIDYISKFNSENAIVFGCRGTLGKVFYCKGKCFILNTAFFVSNNINYGNIYFSLIYEKGLVTYQSGAAQPQITIDAIKDVKLKIPKNNNLNKVLDCICNYQEQIKKLKWIKQLLLLKYFK